MKRWVFLLSLFWFTASLYGVDAKFAVPIKMQGNSITEISTVTFRYGNAYATMSVKLDEIAVDTRALQLTPNNTNYSILWATQTISGSKTFTSTTTFKNTVAVTSITFADDSLLNTNTWYFFSFNNEGQTTSASFQRLMGSTIPLAGTYSLQWNAELTNQNTSKPTEVRVIQFGISTQTFATSNYPANVSGAWGTQSGFTIITTTTSTNYAIEFRVPNAGTGIIRNARLFFKKLQ
jgi:hypothetical protein